ncbi:hypothetical protein GOP47_0007050 [Adiantum capillus-veneris]|uniref:Uncharacterized protein n=1 Tax=Adiantum capillus-veneris TaxID=13818 RepID=A0A9D4V0I6_ADICA|nr:hypothetical protein GOP47_0007050 [Adiantum capillus-veneris]
MDASFLPGMWMVFCLLDIVVMILLVATFEPMLPRPRGPLHGSGCRLQNHMVGVWVHTIVSYSQKPQWVGAEGDVWLKARSIINIADCCMIM